MEGPEDSGQHILHCQDQLMPIQHLSVIVVLNKQKNLTDPCLLETDTMTLIIKYTHTQHLPSVTYSIKHYILNAGMYVGYEIHLITFLCVYIYIYL